MLTADCVRFSDIAARVNERWSATARKACRRSGSKVGAIITIRD
jgi:hypothetical protein